MANDLATGLGLGLKAAEMAQRSEEAEKERDFRGGMAAREDLAMEAAYQVAQS